MRNSGGWSRIIGSRLVIPALFLAAGWYGGAKYGAPQSLVGAVDGTLEQGRETLSPLVADGTDHGRAVIVSLFERGSGYVSGTMERMLVNRDAEDDAAPGGEDADEPAPFNRDDEPEANVKSAAEARSAMAMQQDPPSPHEATVKTKAITLCAMRVSNPPRDGKPAGTIGTAGEMGHFGGVALLLMPASKGCLSSGFGPRGIGRHRGIDYFSDQGGDVLAAGPGVIVEAVARSDYGNMIVIDHGEGIYTRYAHLDRFASGVHAGQTVSRGDRLGPIGKTGATHVDHLHYEILKGDFDTPAKSFGLSAINPYMP